MKTTKKNIYLAALARAIMDDVELDQILHVIGGNTESDAYCWLEEGRTEKEIVALLRKIGYDIPEDFIGSETVKFDSTVQED
jgi:hypothetical protein